MKNSKRNLAWCDHVPPRGGRSPFVELLRGQRSLLHEVVEQQANALSGDGPPLEDHLNAPLHEHVEQRGAVELLHAQERPLQRDRV